MSYADTYSLRTATATLNDIADAIDGIAAVGWLPVSDTWAYASANTITVPSGAAALYAKGDRIRLIQTTTKYFAVVGVADTVLTVTGGSNYTVANAAIGSIYVSHTASPAGYPAYFDLSNPTWTTTGTAFTNQPTGVYTLQIIGARAWISLAPHTHATSGGTGCFNAQFSTAQVPNHSMQDVGSAWNVSSTIAGSCKMANGVQAQVAIMKDDSSAIAGNDAYFFATVSFPF